VVGCIQEPNNETEAARYGAQYRRRVCTLGSQNVGRFQGNYLVLTEGLSNSQNTFFFLAKFNLQRSLNAFLSREY